MRERVAFVAVITAALFGSACGEKVAPPKVLVETVTIGAITPGGADIDTTLDVTNSNNVELTASGAQTKVVIGGKPDTARALLTSPLVLPAGQRNKLRVPIHVEWTSASAIAELAQKKEPAPYSVEGYVEFTSRIGPVRTPFQINGTMTVDELARAAGTAPAPAPASSSSAKPR